MSMEITEHGAEMPRYRYRFCNAEFDEARFDLRVGELTVEVEAKPLLVLKQLLAHVDEVVTKDELIESVWDGRPTSDAQITNALTKLRKALGQAASERVITVPRFGYRLAGPVERMVVGRRLVSRMQLAAGQTVPGREHFELQRQLGLSLGSEVWLACHRKTGEIRVYKFGADGERLAMLKREATVYRVLLQSLGERNDLARVLDWNFASEPFWLESEYGGSNLLDWAAGENRLAPLSPSERIGLFLQIADAVAAAHSVGVLHKDLKPANVLVAPREGGWQLRITDFGSARLLEPGRLAELGITQLGMTLTQDNPSGGAGTPLYLAPELIAGQAPTVQSDLYALGLMLYQMLQADLKQPMAPGWEHNVDDELLRADIAAATDGNPARRLSSVAELADRLRRLEERHLIRRGLIVSERKAHAFARRVDQARARRPWFIAAGASLALGLGASLSLYGQAEHARQLAEREVARAEAINRFLNDDLLGAADVAAPGSVSDSKVIDVVTRAALRAESRFANDPETRAAIEGTLARSYLALSDYSRAETHRRRTLELLEKTRGPGDTEALDSQYRLVEILSMTSKFDEAGKLLDLTDRAAGNRLAQVSPLAYIAHYSRAGYHEMRQENDDVLHNLLKAEQIRHALDAADDGMLYEIRSALTRCYLRLGRPTEAEAALREVMQDPYTLDRLGPGRWVHVRIFYGTALNRLHRSEEAERLLSETINTARSTIGADHYYTGLALNELGVALAARGSFDLAATPIRESFEIMRRHQGDRNQATLVLRANLGIIEYRGGQLQAAIDTLSAARSDLTALLGEKSPSVQGVSFYLASALTDAGRSDEGAALISATDPAALTSTTSGAAGWALRLQALRGQIQIAQGRKTDGLALLVPAIQQMKAAGVESHVIEPFEKVLERAEALAANTPH
jgi:eukaryotic-like serine/threonine-protein kinase